MNAERLIALYDRVADAPDAVARLRRFVLDLAMRGHLVEQDVKDEPATALLDQARYRLRKRAKSAKRVRWIETGAVEPDEINVRVPSGWLPARVNDTALYVNGLAFKPADWKKSGTPIIRIQNLTDSAKGFNFASGTFPDEVVVRSGDILVSWSATLGAFRWEREDGVLNQHIFRVIPDNDLTTREYLLLLLKNAIREMAESRHAHGLVMKHINRGPFLNHIVLIPPLAEQHRIVAKIEELMALCDRLEETRAAREHTRDRLTKASYARLNASDADASSFRAHARFFVRSLPALTARADQIKQMKRAILDLAMRGKLVERDFPEEPISKRPLGEVAIIIAGQSPPGSTYNEAGLGVPFFQGKADFGDLHPVARRWCTAPKKMAEMGDILISVRAPVGPTNIAKERCCIGRGLSAIRPDETVMLRDFVHWSIRHGEPDLVAKGQGSTFTAIRQKDLKSLLVPVFPLQEQRRIVAKIEELMGLCDQMKASLNVSTGARTRLFSSLLHESLTPNGNHVCGIDGFGRSGNQ